MTREERRAYIQSLAASAPALAPEDADLLRTLMPMGARLTGQRRPLKQEQRRRRQAA